MKDFDKLVAERLQWLEDVGKTENDVLVDTYKGEYVVISYEGEYDPENGGVDIEHRKRFLPEELQGILD